MSENNLSDQEISIIDLIKARKKSMTFNQIKSILKIRENEKLNESLKNLQLNKSHVMFSSCNFSPTSSICFSCSPSFSGCFSLKSSVSTK